MKKVDNHEPYGITRDGSVIFYFPTENRFYALRALTSSEWMILKDSVQVFDTSYDQNSKPARASLRGIDQA